MLAAGFVGEGVKDASQGIAVGNFANAFEQSMSFVTVAQLYRQFCQCVRPKRLLKTEYEYGERAADESNPLHRSGPTPRRTSTDPDAPKRAHSTLLILTKHTNKIQK